MLGALTLSIVSHRQAKLVHDLLGDIARVCRPAPLEVILTVNVQEQLPFSQDQFPFELIVVRNDNPKGFGANHNAAAGCARGEYFCVLNPDIRMDADPFAVLLQGLARPEIGVIAPKIVNSRGGVEDNARLVPTLPAILRKAFTGAPSRGFVIADQPVHPDWVAGMFMLFRSDVFRQVGGFDERYFLYYEDVDLCLRLRRLGYDVLLEPRASALHDARRASRSDLRHLLWHVQSLLRFLWSRATGRI